MNYKKLVKLKFDVREKYNISKGRKAMSYIMKFLVIIIK